MTTFFEVSADFAIVVNLPVEDDCDGSLLVEDRLFAGEQIDDRQPAHAQRDAVIEQIAFRIRPAMVHAIAHQAQEFFTSIRRRGARIKIGPTGYAAHRSINHRGHGGKHK